MALANFIKDAGFVGTVGVKKQKKNYFPY